MQNSIIACYVLTTKGLELANAIAIKFKIHIYSAEKLLGKGEYSFTSLPALIAKTFNSYSSHIFIGATGIAVRCISPHIKHKSIDPAVVVCDECGQFAISLLAGHWGGGNELTKSLANHLETSHQTTAVITTASDVNNTMAIDMLTKKNGCKIIDWPKVKHINAAILRKDVLQLYDPKGIFDVHKKSLNHARIIHCNQIDLLDFTQASIGIDWEKLPQHEYFLRLTAPMLYLGIGCKRGTSKVEILSAINKALSALNLEIQALACLASIDIKANELGLVDAARELGLPLHLFDAKKLSSIACPNPSLQAAKLFGVDKISISEGAALLAAGNNDAMLLMQKTKFNGKITIAIALGKNLNLNSTELL